jgi:UDP-N-acetylglucosamine enolpyruvyl transferase
LTSKNGVVHQNITRTKFLQGVSKVLTKFGEDVQGRVDPRIQVLGREELAVMKWQSFHCHSHPDRGRGIQAGIVIHLRT